MLSLASCAYSSVFPCASQSVGCPWYGHLFTVIGRTTPPARCRTLSVCFRRQLACCWGLATSDSWSFPKVLVSQDCSVCPLFGYCCSPWVCAGSRLLPWSLMACVVATVAALQPHSPRQLLGALCARALLSLPCCAQAEI